MILDEPLVVFCLTCFKCQQMYVVQRKRGIKRHLLVNVHADVSTGLELFGVLFTPKRSEHLKFRSLDEDVYRNVCAKRSSCSDSDTSHLHSYIQTYTCSCRQTQGNTERRRETAVPASVEINMFTTQFYRRKKKMHKSACMISKKQTSKYRICLVHKWRTSLCVTMCYTNTNTHNKILFS